MSCALQLLFPPSAWDLCLARGAMASESVRDFILQYKAELEDLTSNVKVTINTLSQLADEWKGEAAPSIAALLEKRLLNVRLWELLRWFSLSAWFSFSCSGIDWPVLTRVHAECSVIPTTSYLRCTC